MTNCSASALWQPVVKGWIATEDGYFGNYEDGADTFGALKTYREERDAWKKAFFDLKGEMDTGLEALRNEFKTDMAKLNEAIETERTGWKREVRKAKAPGFGIFAGGGVDQYGEFHPVVGFGFVWKF